MFRSLRKGPATNSSSTHSLIMHSSDKFAGMHAEIGLLPDDWPQQDYVLKSADEKMTYLVATNREHFEFTSPAECERIEEVMRRRGLSQDIEDYLARTEQTELLSYSDLSSLGLKHVDPALAVDMFLDPNLVIYGYYDNNPCFTAEAEDMGRFTFGDYSDVRQDGEALVLFDRESGNKLRWSREPYEKSSVPELVDVKITDWCGYGCSFCYMGSTKDGQHAPLERIEEIFDELAAMGVFELAIGGGEPAHHPQFPEIIRAAAARGLNFNFTAYGIDWIKDREIVAAMKQTRQTINTTTGVGISVHKAEDVKKIERARKDIFESKMYFLKVMAQTVVGATPYETTRKTMDQCIRLGIPLLLLGFKATGRGADFVRQPEKVEEVRKLLKKAKKAASTPDQYGYAPRFTLSVDTCFVDTYGDLLVEMEIPHQLWASPEGAFSMYVDAVEDEVAPSSYGDPALRQPRGDMRAQFQSFEPKARPMPSAPEKPKRARKAGKKKAPELYEGSREKFLATAADGSQWSMPFDVVLGDMLAQEDDDDKWPRPITRKDAATYLADNSTAMDGWILEYIPTPSLEGILVDDKEF